MVRLITAHLRRLGNTFSWSLAGWRQAWVSELSLRQWTVVNILSAALAFILDLSGAERALILALGLMILAAELFNTAIEVIVDQASPERTLWAKKAKDCASAGVTLVALAGGVAWIAVLAG